MSVFSEKNDHPSNGWEASAADIDGMEAPGVAVAGMFDGPVPPLLAKLSLPVLAGTALQLLYGIVDTLWVSRIDIGDPSYVGGIGIVFPLFFLVIALGSGIMIGASSLVARAAGAKDNRILERVAGSGLAVGAGIGALLLGFGYGFDREIILLLGARGDTFIHALEYFRSMLPAGFLMLAGNTLIGALQGEGRMDKVMKAVIIGTLANFALDPVFIFLLGYGVRGAGYATVSAQLAAGLYVVSLYARGKTLAPIRWKLSDVDGRVISRMLSVGIPQTIGQLAMSVSFLAFNRIIVGIDSRALASFTLCGRFDQVMVLPILAIASAEITMVGQNFGRGNRARVRKIWNTCILGAAAVSGFVGTLLFLFAPALYPLFTSVDAVDALAVGQTRTVVFSYLFASAAVLGRAYFQAVGRAIPGLVIDALRLFVIPLPAALLLVHGAGFGVPGVWLAIVMGNVGSAFVAVTWVTRAHGRSPAAPVEPFPSRR